MCTYAEGYLNSRSMSLIERKKQQWAKEREEMARLNPSTWGGGKSNLNNCNRSLYGSNSKLSTVSGRTTNRSNCNENERRGSLPPLYKNQYNSANNNYDRDRGGETSGYGSDTPTPENNTHWRQNNQQSGYESSSSYRDDRPKWGDKGVGVGKFWQPKEESLDKIGTSEPPNWVKRGLQDGEILVSNNSPPAASPEQHYDHQDHERPCTSSSFSHTNKLTFIRGQNIPLDAVEMAERERKRQIALAHQEAIRQQLQERERKRMEERERRVREEREEELRIEREQQYERQRRLEEERLLQEKLERERRRKEAIKEAMELAEKEVKLEKMRLKMLKQKSNIVHNNITENVEEKEKVTESVIIEVKHDITNLSVPTEKHINEEQQQNTNNKQVFNDATAVSNSLDIKNDLEKTNNLQTAAPTENTISLNNNSNNTRALTPTIPNTTATPRNSISDATNNIAFLLDSLPNLNLQYAFILPNMNPGVAQIPIAVPLNVPQSARSVVSTTRTENRVLTPSQYRTGKNTCDSSTQTDNSLVVLEEESGTSKEQRYYAREKLTNLELTYDNRRSKERRRSRSESVGERPKWNANRPPTRYLKQSEKDPLYQRRKMRQKCRDDEKNSSDDSQICSPRYNSGKNSGKRHHSRGTWRKNDQIFTRNIRMYQTEIVPLETDKDQLYYKCCCTCKCQRHKCGDNVKVDMLKIEETSPRENLEYRAEVLHRDVLPELRGRDGTRSKVDILDKLSSLHNGLLLEQEKWENSPRTPAEY